MKTKKEIKKLDNHLWYEVHYLWLNLFWLKYTDAGYPSMMYTLKEASYIEFAIKAKPIWWHHLINVLSNETNK